MSQENPFTSPSAGLEPPRGSAATPAVVPWFKVYASAMALLYVFCLLAGIAMFFIPDAALEDADFPPEFRIAYGAMLIVMGGGLAAIFAVGVFAPPRSWVWVFDIVLIAIGMTSCCCMPVSIPLLIYWIKPEVKTYFGRAAT